MKKIFLHSISFVVTVIFVVLATSYGGVYPPFCGDPNNVELEATDGSSVTNHIRIKVVDRISNEPLATYGTVRVNHMVVKDLELQYCPNEGAITTEFSKKVHIQTDNSGGFFEFEETWLPKDKKDRLECFVELTPEDDENYTEYKRFFYVHPNQAQTTLTISLLRL